MCDILKSVKDQITDIEIESTKKDQHNEPKEVDQLNLMNMPVEVRTRF